MTALVTGRLTLRPVTEDDRATLHALFTEPGVRRFIFDDEILAPEQTASIVATSVEQFRDRGLGLWIARPSARGVEAEAVGFGGFWFFREPPELELLYGVSDRHLKRGFGRDIARGIVGYGFDTLAMPTIRASTDAAHHDSRRLLSDLGFVFEREAIVAGLPTAFFSCDRAARRGQGALSA